MNWSDLALAGILVLVLFFWLWCCGPIMRWWQNLLIVAIYLVWISYYVRMAVSGV